MILFMRTFSRHLWIYLAGAAWVSATPPNEFFALDTIARGDAATASALIKDCGYDGIGGRALDDAMPARMAELGLKYFSGYLVVSFSPELNVPDDQLQHWFDAVSAQHTVLWVAIEKVTRRDGTVAGHGDREAEELVVKKLQEIAGEAHKRNVRLALYHHTGYWMERFEDSARLAKAIDRSNVGITFNLCHWLKIEGSERDPIPLIKDSLPLVMLVTVNGADTGDTQSMNWDRLIQPLDSGTYDVAKFVHRLIAVGYRQPVGFQGYGIKGDLKPILTRSMNAWKSFEPDAKNKAN
jgi:sugar phosphate isomerase/epimerase